MFASLGGPIETERHLASRKWFRRPTVWIATVMAVAFLSTAVVVMRSRDAAEAPRVPFSEPRRGLGSHG